MMVHDRRIDSFCQTGTGATPLRQKADRYFGGPIPWVKSGELRESLITKTEESVTETALSETSLKLIPTGAILVAMYGATIGRVGLLGVPATTNQAICHVVPDSKVADTRYCYHALRTRTSEFIGRGVGGAQPNISQAIVRETKIRLPSLPEQRRIAAILDQADALRAKRRAALALLDEMAQAIFDEMFGDPTTNPKNWPLEALSSLAEDGDSINYGVVQPGDDFENGIPIVRVGDLIDGRVRHSNLKLIDPVIESAYKRSRLRGDEILISCVGSIGVVSLTTPDEKGFNIARAVARVRVGRKVKREFLAAYLRTPFVQDYFTKELRTVSQPTLNIKQVGETKIVVPPLAEQDRFIERLNLIEKLREALVLSRLKLDALFASLQHRAFRGEL